MRNGTRTEYPFCAARTSTSAGGGYGAQASGVWPPTTRKALPFSRMYTSVVTDRRRPVQFEARVTKLTFHKA
jgi:hypothetical protein